MNLTCSQYDVVAEAADHGWTARWQHRLLILSRRTSTGGTRMAQVLFTDAGRWWYALTWERGPGVWLGGQFPRFSGTETTPVVMRRRRDLFDHLSQPDLPIAAMTHV